MIWLCHVLQLFHWPDVDTAYYSKTKWMKCVNTNCSSIIICSVKSLSMYTVVTLLLFLSGILRSTKKKDKVRPPISPEKVSLGALVWNVQVNILFLEYRRHCRRSCPVYVVVLVQLLGCTYKETTCVWCGCGSLPFSNVQRYTLGLAVLFSAVQYLQWLSLDNPFKYSIKLILYPYRRWPCTNPNYYNDV